MPANIQTFFTQASQKQFSRDILFRIKQISLPGLNLNGETDLVYAKSGKIPSRTIEDKTVSYAGQKFHLGGTANYGSSEGYSIDFYCDQALDLRTKLERASRVAFNNEDTTANMCMPGVDSIITLDVLSIPCTTDINATSGNPFEVVKTIELVGVGIRDIGEITYAIAEGTGDIVSFSATFSYHFYRNFARG
jgi:hypothetical protein